VNYAENPSVQVTLQACTVKTRHLRDDNGHPWGTVVVIEGLDFTVIGASSCHKWDTFSKKKGRYIAEQRAMRGLAEKIGLTKPHTNPMTMRLDRTLDEGERPVVETIYSEPDCRHIEGCEIPDTPTRSVVLITEGPSKE